MKNKHLILSIIFLSLSIISFSQNFSGFSYDNYSGVQRLSLNPAYVVDSPYNIDINLVGSSFFMGNDYVTIDFEKPLDDLEPFFEIIKNTEENTTNNFNLNSEILGPSFMFNIGKSNALGVFTKARNIISVSDIDMSTYNHFADEGFESDTDYSIDISNMAVSAHLWGEIGLTFGRILKKTDHSLLKAGANVKYIQGGGNAFISFKDTKIQYDSSSETVNTIGELSYGASFDISDTMIGADFSDYYNGDASGIGFDMGVVYQWSPNLKDGEDESKQPKFYKYRIAFSITDLGSINYPTGNLRKYNLNKDDINPDDMEGDDLIAIIDNLYDGQISVDKLVVQLPTAAHLNFDYSFTNHFYVNVNGDFSLSDASKNAGEIIPNFLLTPRYESKWFSAYLPMNYDTYKNTALGIGVRLGPIFIGSNTALSAFFKPIKKVDVHFGVKIPLYKKTKKNIDTD